MCENFCIFVHTDDLSTKNIMETTIERNRTARTTISKAGVPKRATASKRRSSEPDITPERREELIKELRASLEKSLEEERLAKEKNGYLWEIPKEKKTPKERRLAIADLKASVKRGVYRRFAEDFLRELINDRNS